MPRIIRVVSCQEKMFPSDQLTATYKEHLDDCVPCTQKVRSCLLAFCAEVIFLIRIISCDSIHCDCDNITVIPVRTGDLLSFTDLFYAFYKIPVRSCFLITHFLRGGHHLLCKRFDFFLIVPFQKINHPVDAFPVLFL